MATIKNGQVLLENGQSIVTPQEGAWYDGQQYFGGTLSGKNQINSLSPQKGAGQQVSREVVAASNPAQGLPTGTNEKYLGLNNGGVNNGVSSTVAPGVAIPAPSPMSDLEKRANDIQTTINTKKAEADKRRSEVNENPFLSEASRVGRIAKIDSALNDTIATDQSSLTSLQTQINSEKELQKPDYQITTETDNAGNMTVVTIDKKTGKLVSSVNAGKIGKADKPSSKSDTEISKENKTVLVQTLYSKANSYGHVPPEIWNAAKQAWVDDGLGTPDDFDKQFGGLTDPQRKDYGQTSGYQMNKDYRDKLFGL